MSALRQDAAAMCGEPMENGPGKRYVVCYKCGAVDYERNEGDKCTAARIAKKPSRPRSASPARPSFATTLKAVQDAGEDHEWYPTSERMIAVVARHIPTDAASIMDIGAGDGRVLLQLAKKCEHAELYAIEKSNVLIQAQPENVIPVGTDLFEQNLACLPVDVIYANPPYSEFELWTTLIIESGHAKKAFLVIPRRWKENEGIAIALKKRGATARIIHSDDFLTGADRAARAVIDIVEVSYPRKGDHGWRSDEVKDPFDQWFDEHITTFDEEEPDDYRATEAAEQRELARIRQFNTIVDMVDGYNEEYARMEENYKAIFRLDHALLKELGVKKDALRDGIKKKMAGLKSKYWTLLFERLDVITERLSTATKKAFLEKLTGRVALAFTANNAYAIVIWAVKNANAYFKEQLIQLYRDLSTFDGVMNYASNRRTWEQSAWRYRHPSWNQDGDRPTHYALDYRIVVVGYRAIGNGERHQFDYRSNLSDSCHEQIADIIAVLYNLGFRARGQHSLNRQWYSGGWQDWYLTHDGLDARILFQVKAYKNGNIHLRFMPDAIKAINVEAGRLLGWLHSADEVVTELGYTPAEAKRFYCSTKLIAPSNVKLLTGTEGGQEVVHGV